MTTTATKLYHSSRLIAKIFSADAHFSLTCTPTHRRDTVILPEQIRGRLFTYDSEKQFFTTTSTVAQLGDSARRVNGLLEYHTAKGDVMKFDSSGRLTALSDPNGNPTTLEYTGNNLTKITDATGRSITLQYNAPNCPECVWKAIDPLGRTTTYGYDTQKRLVTVTDPLNHVTSYGYLGPNPGLITSITDPRGNTVKLIGYSSSPNRVISQTFADGSVEKYSYTFSGRVVTGVAITDTLGRVKTKRFNAAGYVISEADELGQASRIERKIIDNNLATSTTGPCNCTGPEEERTYDERGNLKSRKDRLGKTEFWEYEPNFNQVTKYTDKLGRVTNYEYDAKGNLKSNYSRVFHRAVSNILT